MKTIGMVEACLRGTTGARFTRRFAGKSVLEWVVRRLTDCTRIEGVIVVTGDEPEDASVRRLVPLDVPVFAGSQPDALSRFAAALASYSAEGVVRVSADDLFLDPVLIDRLVRAAYEEDDIDYVGYRLRDGRPAALAPVRIGAEWFRVRSLHRAARLAKVPEDREHVARFLCSQPERFCVHFLPAPAELDRDDVRLTMDIEEDWETALTLLEALGPERFDLHGIAHLLDHQPAMRRRMAQLNQVAAGN